MMAIPEEVYGRLGSGGHKPRQTKVKGIIESGKCIYQ